MKTSILALCLAFLCRAQAAPTPEAAMDYVPAHGNLNSGFADPLTLAMRVEESRRQKYGNMNSSDAQSKIAFTQLNTVPLGGCGSHCRSTLSFSGKEAQKFAVGNNIPSVGFKTKDSWAGNLPIASSMDRELFFWLWGAETPSNDLVIWLNGGPGCSSLAGFLQENGPISYQPGTSAPIDSSKTTSWTQEANVLYIEQPVGTGFTVGSPYAQNEDDVAAAVSGFLDSFYQTFPEMKSKKLWITGESYAGTFIPYISSALYKRGNKHNLQGIMLIDPSIANPGLLNYLVTSDFVAVNNEKYLHLNNAQVKKINEEAIRCGYGINGKNTTSYAARNLKYPPTGPIESFSEDCYVFDYLIEAAQTQNPDYNIYDISEQQTPSPPNVLGNPNDPDQASKSTWFDNKDLQTYINAPHKKWNLCQTVFPNGDGSPTPDQTVLGSVIDQAPSKRNVIANGDLDGLIMTNGTALALQNLTWGGARGFSKPPSTNRLYDLKGEWSGGFVTERGLTFGTVFKSGHMIPESTPYTGRKLLQYLLGKTKNLGA